MRLILIAAAVLAVDQVTKYIVQDYMYRGESIPVLTDIFHLTYIQNPGAAFGILANQTWFFVMITVAVIASILLGYRFLSDTRAPLRVSLGMIAGGATGNLIDRLRLGKVIDFLDFRIWPVFNMADVAIVIGAAMLIWYVWKSGQDEKKVESNAGE